MFITNNHACGERKICSTIKKSQNIMNMIGGPYHIENSSLICCASANQWNGFYMIETSVMKELTRAYLGPCQISMIKLFYENS